MRIRRLGDQKAKYPRLKPPLMAPGGPIGRRLHAGAGSYRQCSERRSREARRATSSPVDRVPPDRRNLQPACTVGRFCRGSPSYGRVLASRSCLVAVARSIRWSKPRANRCPGTALRATLPSSHVSDGAFPRKPAHRARRHLPCTEALFSRNATPGPGTITRAGIGAGGASATSPLKEVREHLAAHCHTRLSTSIAVRGTRGSWSRSGDVWIADGVQSFSLSLFHYGSACRSICWPPTRSRRASWTG